MLVCTVSPWRATGNTTRWLVDNNGYLETKFSLRTAEEPEEDVCYIRPGRQESITECGFNVTAQTFAIIHGWSVGNLKSYFGCSNIAEIGNLSYLERLFILIIFIQVLL